MKKLWLISGIENSFRIVLKCDFQNWFKLIAIVFLKNYSVINFILKITQLFYF
jgi:hypothetical protein